LPVNRALGFQGRVVKILKNILNVIITALVMWFGLLTFISLISTYEGDNQMGWLPLALLTGILFFSYFLNKPNGNKIQLSFWQAKWKLSTFVLVYFLFLASLYSVPTLEAFFHSGLMLGPVHISVGMWSTVIPTVIIVRFVLSKIWFCPACYVQLPFLALSNSKKAGFSMQSCPHCSEELVKT
jgi:hypothetical protein